MKTLLRAGLLALPLSLLLTPTASAQYPGYGGPGCGAGGCGPGPFPMYPTHHMPCPNFDCGGFCLNRFARLHFHGPLFNYGPYCGYYPFEPYGPWTSDLRYNGSAACGQKLFGHGDRGAWGQYAKDTLRNVFQRLHPSCHKSKCGSSDGCAAAPAAGGCNGCTALLTEPAAIKTVGATVLLAGPVR